MSQGPSKEEYERAVQALHEWLPPRRHPSIAKQLSAASLACSPANLYACVMSSCAVPMTSSQAERLRDAVFVPMAKYSTDPVLMSAFFTAMSALMQPGTPDHLRAAFATPEIVAVIVDLGAKAALCAEKVDVRRMYSFLLQISLPLERIALVLTPAVRDTLFVACAKHATTSEARHALNAAMMNLMKVHGGRELFATPAVRDKVIIPSGRIAASPECAEEILNALILITPARPNTALFHTFAVRDQVFMPLAKYATNHSTVVSFFCAIKSIAETKPGSALFCTKAVRDRLFVALARHVTSAAGATVCLEALSTVIQPPCREPLILNYDGVERRELFAVKSVRDFVILPLARLRPGVLYLAEALLFLASSPSGPTVFGTATVRDEIILPMVPIALDDGDYATGCLIMFVRMLCEPSSGQRPAETSSSSRWRTPASRTRVLSARCVACYRAHIFMTPRACLPPRRSAMFLFGLRGRCLPAKCRRSSRLAILIFMRPSCFATCAVRDGIFVRLFEMVAPSQRATVEFVAALSAFRDTKIDVQAPHGRSPLLVTERDEMPLTFRQQVLVLLAEKATTVHTAALLAQAAV